MAEILVDGDTDEMLSEMSEMGCRMDAEINRAVIEPRLSVKMKSMDTAKRSHTTEVYCIHEYRRNMKDADWSVTLRASTPVSKAAPVQNNPRYIIARERDCHRRFIFTDESTFEILIDVDTFGVTDPFPILCISPITPRRHSPVPSL